MEPAMKASAQVEGKEPFHVKVVAAPRAENKCHWEYRLAEKDNPDDKYRGKSRVRMGQHDSYPHCWHIGKAN
jgi:hypothetical protein